MDVRDGYRCVYCGSTEDVAVDLEPRLTSNHRIATIDACRSCNSRRGVISRLAWLHNLRNSACPGKPRRKGEL